MALQSWLRAVLAASVALAPGCARRAREYPSPAPAGAWQPAAKDAEVEDFLLHSEIVERHDAGSGVTVPQKVILRRGADERRALFKTVHQAHPRPITGQRPQGGLYFADQWEYEVAAYRLDRLLQLGLVPVTVERRIDGERGSLQQWIDGAITEKQRVRDGISPPDPERFTRAVARMRLFDALIYNIDRNQGNILIVPGSGEVWMIDHSRTFRLDPHLPPRTAEQIGALPKDLAQRLAALDAPTLRAVMGHLLTLAQIRSLLARRDRILELRQAKGAPDS